MENLTYTDVAVQGFLMTWNLRSEVEIYGIAGIEGNGQLSSWRLSANQ